MKKSTALNRKTSRMIAKNLIILLVLAVVAFLSIWAWFTKNSKANANGIEVECTAPDSLEIAVVGHGEAAPENSDYSKGSVFLKNQKFLETLILSEVTGDGVKFYKPMLIQNSGVATPNPDVYWNNAVVNENYLSFDLYLRSESQQTVYLESSSKFVTASAEIKGENSGNISSYGEFSRDCIVGAARFSVVDTGGDRKLLWIPRPDLRLDFSQNKYEIYTNVTNEQFDGDTYKHSYWRVDGNTKTPTALSSSDTITSVVSGSDYVLGKKTEIARLDERGDDGYYTKHVVCNMWIEGEDSEARLALVKGQFKINLDLSIKN